MTDAQRVKILTGALRKVRDRNKKRAGLFDTKTQEICREALKTTAQPRDGE